MCHCPCAWYSADSVTTVSKVMLFCLVRKYWRVATWTVGKSIDCCWYVDHQHVTYRRSDSYTWSRVLIIVPSRLYLKTCPPVPVLGDVSFAYGSDAKCHELWGRAYNIPSIYLLCINTLALWGWNLLILFVAMELGFWVMSQPYWG
jgi:hypothetical protein